MSIIAINGKIGTGKDTIGKIVQYLVSTKNEKNVVSFEDAIKYDSSFITSESSGWEVRKFAGKLKEIASILTGISIEKFEDQEFKKTFLGNEWNQDNENGFKMSVRQLLQRLGTEALRNGLHENVWVNALFADYKTLGFQDKPSAVLEFPNWLITDLRFPNEFQAVKDRNGICVRVIRHQHPNDIDYKTLHPSETSLDSFIFDYEINNSGSIEDLVEEVRKMLINFKII